jgi:phosphoglycolate phosphatase-like HAD superfamily hydrolase
VFPREWQRAWQMSCAGDVERMEHMRELFERFGASYVFPNGKRSLAALKRALYRLGVLSSDAVAPGTAPLDAEQQARFDAAFDALQAELPDRLPSRWISDPREADAS